MTGYLIWSGRSGVALRALRAGPPKSSSRRSISSATFKPRHGIIEVRLRAITGKSASCWSIGWSIHDLWRSNNPLRSRRTLTHRFRDLLALEPPTRTNSVFSRSSSHSEIQKHPLKKLSKLRGKTVALAFFGLTRGAHHALEPRRASARAHY